MTFGASGLAASVHDATATLDPRLLVIMARRRPMRTEAQRMASSHTFDGGGSALHDMTFCIGLK